MDNFQPNKMSQRSVKIPYGINHTALNVTDHRVLFDLLNIIWAKPITYPTTIKLSPEFGFVNITKKPETLDHPIIKVIHICPSKLF